jgi:AcrR family transcriptional regulator
MGLEAGRIGLPRVAGAGELCEPGLRRLRLVGRSVSEAERGRLLDAICAVVDELGYRQTTVRGIARRAGVSHRVFYELFRDREDCFLAAFERGIDELGFVATAVWRAERRWELRIRACLAVLLAHLDEDPALGRLVFVEALSGGPRVLTHRAHVLGKLAEVLDAGRVGRDVPHRLPPLTAEGMIGAAFSLIHARLCESQPTGSLVELLNPLMAMIVLPYRGQAAAGRELAHGRVQNPGAAIAGTPDASRLTPACDEVPHAGRLALISPTAAR